MTKKPTEIMGEIVDLLTPLPSEDRQKIIKAALTMLGESASAVGSTGPGAPNHDENSALPTKAQIWFQQNGLTHELLQQVFHLADTGVEVIAEPPGTNKRERTLNAYVLTGTANFLTNGDSSFTDDAARALCISSGCYDPSNHSVILKNRGNEFTGSKSTGWTLTAPGLKRAATMVKELARAN